MKRRFFYFKLISCLAIPILLLSCISDNVISSGEDQEALIKVKRNGLIGKWKFEDKGFRVTQQANAYLQFFQDDSYVLAKSNGNVISGSYYFKNLNEIIVENFGLINNLVINASQASFHFVSEGKEGSMNARKAEELSNDDKTNLLCRKWKMLPVENGKDSLGPFVDSSFVTFYNDGSYITECYTNGRIRPLKFNYFWAWHPTLTDRFVYWANNRERDDNKYYTIAREVTTDELKFSESRLTGLFSYTFQPAK